MNNATLLVSQVRYEQKSFRRNPMASVFTVAFPVLFLVIFGSVGGHSTVNGARLTESEFLVPTMIAYGLMNACFSNLAVTLTMRRESGVLKRVRGTPLSPWVFLGGIIGNVAVMSAVLVVVVTGIGMGFYHVPFPAHPLAGVATLAVGIVGFCAMGIAMTSFVPNADAAPAIVNSIYLPLVFISGIFFPVNQSSVLGRIGNFFPMRHFALSLLDSFESGKGSGFHGHELLIVAIWAVAALIVARRRFRWEPNRK